tara:strand:+ start:271 stop:600 length:330 start_codon:yes stop_codon:yes gene_type:complete
MISVKYLMDNVPDRMLGAYTIDKKGTTIVEIPNGRVIILPKSKKIKEGYSLRHGGRKTEYVCHHPSWLLKEEKSVHKEMLMRKTFPKRGISAHEKRKRYKDNERKWMSR